MHPPIVARKLRPLCVEKEATTSDRPRMGAIVSIYISAVARSGSCRVQVTRSVKPCNAAGGVSREITGTSSQYAVVDLACVGQAGDNIVLQTGG